MKNQNIIDKPLLMPETLKNELFLDFLGSKWRAWKMPISVLTLADINSNAF